MEKKRAVELLIQEVDKIPYLKTLPPSNDEFRLWLKNVENIINKGLEPEDKNKYQEASQFLRYLRGVHEEDFIQQDYIDEIVRYEIALKSIIQRYKILGISEKPTENILRYSSFEDPLKQTQQEAEKQSESVEIDTKSPNYPVEQSYSLSEGRAIWKAIKNDFDITKNNFGRKINFITNPFKRTIIFRDVEQAFILASLGFSKPAVILAGGVIEELLRLYLEHKNITPINNSFDGYIQTCEQKVLLKAGISRLSDSARHFRNLVHLSKEESKRTTISKSTAKGAVASIFTIANDF